MTSSKLSEITFENNETIRVWGFTKPHRIWHQMRVNTKRGNKATYKHLIVSQGGHGETLKVVFTGETEKPN